MDTWTQQMGFPVVVLTRDGEIIKMSQKRFLVSSEKNETSLLQPKSPFDYKWYIPVTYYTDKEPDTVYKAWLNMTYGKVLNSHVKIYYIICQKLSACCILHMRIKEIKTNCVFHSVDLLEMPQDIDYIKCNVNQTGFYRVNYTEDMWTAIIHTLWNNHTKFSPADRANLIDDAFSLNEAGMLHAVIPLKLSLYLVKERDYVPWETAQAALHSWRKRLCEHSAYRMFIAFFRRLLKPVVRYVNQREEESHLEKSVYLSSAY